MGIIIYVFLFLCWVLPSVQREGTLRTNTCEGVKLVVKEESKERNERTPWGG